MKESNTTHGETVRKVPAIYLDFLTTSMGGHRWPPILGLDGVSSLERTSALVRAMEKFGDWINR